MPTPPPTGKPSAANTGVPAGTVLRSIASAYPDAATQGYSVNAQGRVTITKDGGVYDRLLVPDGIVVKAKNVTIKNSKITGGRSSFTSLPAEPTSWAHCRNIVASGQRSGSGFIIDASAAIVSNLLIQDSEIAVKNNEYSNYINDFMGHDTTMRRVNLHGGVDGIGTHNGYASIANFTVEDSYIHDLYKGSWSPYNHNTNPTTGEVVMCGYDAAHPEGTHSDGIQFHSGTGISILRNTIFVNAFNAAQTNAGIMMNVLNVTGDVHVSGNHFRWGACSVNMVPGLKLPVDVSNNTFYGNNGAAGTAGQDAGGCAIIRPSSAGYNFVNNKWENGTAIKLTGG
jgi:hypothetical protein